MSYSQVSDGFGQIQGHQLYLARLFFHIFVHLDELIIDWEIKYDETIFDSMLTPFDDTFSHQMSSVIDRIWRQ